jgi:hypothetical protein
VPKTLVDLPVGAIAYMDGRDPDAQPPLTVYRINLWKEVPRRKVVGTLSHGDRVKIIHRREHEGRTYYRVQHHSKKGWVSAPFVSNVKHEPIGDSFG